MRRQRIIARSMEQLPFNIPKSLSSYVETFDNDPVKATKKLQRHVKKRDPDAVGHFLLAWFYHIQEQNQEAIKEALIAKNYAPGSPLMEHLHYFLVHPELFDAIVPESGYSDEKKLKQAHRSSPILDLDRLIEMLEAVESKSIRLPDDESEVSDEDLSDSASDVEDIVSETLARIHVMQGKTQEAIKMYERLIVENSDRAGHYTSEIDKLKKD